MKWFKPHQRDEEELDQMHRSLVDQEISKKEEWLIIFTALRTFLPYMFLTFVLVWGLLIIILFLL